MDISALIALIIVIIMLASALCVLFLPNMIAAVMASSVVSLSLTIIFALLKAPDVAMTEAAIGAGLGSLILAIGLKRLGYININSQSADDNPTVLNKQTVLNKNNTVLNEANTVLNENNNSGGK